MHKGGVAKWVGVAASVLALWLPSPAPAGATVVARQANLETADFSQFDQTNTQAGTIATSTTRAYDGGYSAQSTYSGGGQNGFSRAIYNVDWQDGDDVYYGEAVFLPAGFLNSMQGEVDLMRWDNWTLDPNTTDRCGVVIYGSDKLGHYLCWQNTVSGSSTAQIGPFNLPEGQWNWIEVHEHISQTDGQALSEVWVNGVRVGSSTQHNSFGRPATRLRFGIVAMDAGVQTNALTLYFDRPTVSTGYIGPIGGTPTSGGTVNQPPAVSLTTPAAGSTFTRSLAMSADAQDDGGVQEVDFLVDGRKVGVDTTAPYTYTWSASKKTTYGTHTVTAVAYDVVGAQATSAPVTVTRVR
jgi:hypothetical protein